MVPSTQMALLLWMSVVCVGAFSPSEHKKNSLLRKKIPKATLGNENDVGGTSSGAVRVLEATHHDDGNGDGSGANQRITHRRSVLTSMASLGVASLNPWQVAAEDAMPTALSPVQVAATGDTKKLFNEGSALEAQGNVLAAQRLYIKVTKVAPRFIYGWSNLGNTLAAQGQLDQAEDSYGTAISLCEESLKETEGSMLGVKRCTDLYLILLNRGSVRLNNGMPREALSDLQRSESLRARPDAVILQNLARAQELNSLYAQSDRTYDTAIAMTANEVNPFWLRSSLVKYQIGDVSGAMDLTKRIDNRFPQAPEVRAAYAVLLWAKGDQDAARKKFLEIPDRQRKKFIDVEYMDKVVSWPPTAKATIGEVAKAVGDSV